MFKIGDFVKPLKSLKRKQSLWLQNFSGKKYKIMAFDNLESETMLVLKTGHRDIDYQLVYQNEVK